MFSNWLQIMNIEVLEYKQVSMKQEKTEKFKGRQPIKFKGSENTWITTVTVAHTRWTLTYVPGPQSLFCLHISYSYEQPLLSYYSHI